MKRLASILAVVVLSACAGGHRPAEISNPYIEQSRHLTQAGMTAMQRERWAYAQSAFARALSAAQLTDAPELVAQGWYNLGMARKSGGKVEAAVAAFREARQAAHRAGDASTELRARLALALLQKAPDWYPDTVKANLPSDIHLSAARLAERQHRVETARYEYQLALKRSDKSRQGLIYRGQAYLGLGLLAQEAGDGQAASHRMQQALALFRKAGVPRLIAYTLLRLAESNVDMQARAADIRHARAIYRTMGDEAGQKACVEALERIGLAE